MAFIATTKNITLSNTSEGMGVNSKMMVLDTDDCVVEHYVWSDFVSMYDTLKSIGEVGGVFTPDERFGRVAMVCLVMVELDSLLRGRWTCKIGKGFSGKVGNVFIDSRCVMHCEVVDGRQLNIYGSDSNRQLGIAKFEQNWEDVSSIGFTWAQKLGSFYKVDILVSVSARRSRPYNDRRVMIKAILDSEKCLGVYDIVGDIKESSLLSKEDIPRGLLAKMALADGEVKW